MLTCALQSGSNGNSIYVETVDVRLLFDAGIGAKVAQQRLAAHERNIRTVDALIISHNHIDHISSAGAFQRQFGVPIHMTERVWQASRAKLGRLTDVRHFAPGQRLHFRSTTIETIPTAHDGLDGVAFIIAHDGKRLGIFTDLGHRFAGIERWISDLDGLYLESNYDPQLLADGPYPAWLQRRITGGKGHLSNHQAAQLVQDCGQRLQLLVLAHLSECNNRPRLALETARAYLTRQLPIALASRTAATKMFVIE